jgi:hypothetical protein
MTTRVIDRSWAAVGALTVIAFSVLVFRDNLRHGAFPHPVAIAVSLLWIGLFICRGFLTGEKPFVVTNHVVGLLFSRPLWILSVAYSFGMVLVANRGFRILPAPVEGCLDLVLGNLVILVLILGWAITVISFTRRRTSTGTEGAAPETKGDGKLESRN